MSTSRAVTEIQEKVIPTLPYTTVVRILQFLPTKDLKNCRLVSYNWVCMVDVYVGLGLKLNKTNKAKLFASHLIRSCTKLKIFQSAGLLNWYACFFSPWKLKCVEILENIREDNWRLLLTQCKGIQNITLTAHIVSFSKTTKVFTRKDNSFDFEDEIPEKVDHCSLRRLFFKNMDYSDSDPEIEWSDYQSIASVLNTIGIAPQLRQIVISSYSWRTIFFPIDAILKDSVVSLMQRNPGINSFGTVIPWFSSYHDIKLWDTFLKEDRACLAHISGVYDGWVELFNNMLSVNTLYYGIFTYVNWTGFSTLMANIIRKSRSLKTLFLAVGSYWDAPWVLNCQDIQQGLQNLKELSVRIFHVSNFDPESPTLQNLNVLTSSNTLLEYLDISLQLTEEDLTAILNIPRLAELHIRLQKSAEVFNEQHREKILNHLTLKLIFWQQKMQTKWNQLNEGVLHHNWQNVEMQAKKFEPFKFSTRKSEPMYLPFTDNGLFALKTWTKYGFAHTFALFHKERVTDSDRHKLREDYY